MALSWPWPPCRRSLAWPNASTASRRRARARTKGKGCALLAYVAQLLHGFTRRGVSLTEAERLKENQPFQGVPGRREAGRSDQHRGMVAGHWRTGLAAVAAAEPRFGPIGPGPGRAGPLPTSWAARNVASSIRRSKSAGCRWKGPRSSTRAGGRHAGNGCWWGRLWPTPCWAPPARRRRVPAGMGAIRRRVVGCRSGWQPARMAGTRPGVLGMPTAPAVRATAGSALPSISALGA